MARYRASGFIRLTNAILQHSQAPVLVEAGPRLARWLMAYLRQLNRWEQLARALHRLAPSRPPTRLVMPAVPPSVLLDLPPEFDQVGHLRSDLRATLDAANRLAGPTSTRALWATTFRRDLTALITMR
jgi:hypothetical protein